MFGRRSTLPPTSAQAARMDNINRLGCIACRMLDPPAIRPCTVHHLTIGGRHGQKRRGHDFTVGLCDWHHQGLGVEKILVLLYGPSYARQPLAFRERFGRDEELLEFQDELLQALSLADGTGQVFP